VGWAPTGSALAGGDGTASCGSVGGAGPAADGAVPLAAGAGGGSALGRGVGVGGRASGGAAGADASTGAVTEGSDGASLGAGETGGAAAAAAARARPAAAPRIAAAAATPGRTRLGPLDVPSGGAGVGGPMVAAPGASQAGASGGDVGAPAALSTGRAGGPDHTGRAAPFSVRSRRRSSLACDICPPTGPGRGAPGPGVATECRGTYPAEPGEVRSCRACRPPLRVAPSETRRWISSRTQLDPGSGSASPDAPGGAPARWGTEPSSGSGFTDGGAPSVKVVTADSTPASSP
jgi:hypothetical protein